MVCVNLYHKAVEVIAIIAVEVIAIIAVEVIAIIVMKEAICHRYLFLIFLCIASI